MVATATTPLRGVRWRALDYQAEIDGLRAVAVLSVLLFHLNRDLLGGGFVGVDVFFAISGFLIGSILLADLDEGRFSLLRFYQRRIARIAPALFLVIVATLAAAAFIYSAQDLASTGSASAFAALSLINIKYMLQGDYFTISPDAQPLLHYWSLAVEEQFYLVFPFYLFLAVRFTRRPLVITLVLAAVSFALCLALTWKAPVYAFYLLPTRAWELLAGAALAMHGAGNSRRWAPASSWAGAALLVAAVVLIREDSYFPGFVAALPVAGALLLIHGIGAGDHPINRLLGHPAATAIGRRSYSLYLWHWPVFSMVDYRLFDADARLRLAVKIGVTVLATLLTYRFVERPMRRMLNEPGRGALTGALFLAVSAAIVIVGVQVRGANYLAARPAILAKGGTVVRGGGRGVVAIIGDSHGAMYGRTLADIARRDGFELHVLAVPAGNELPGERDSRWPDIERFLAKARPDVVLVAEVWDSKLGNGEHLDAALDRLALFSGHLIVLTQPPRAPPDATREAIRDGARPPFFEPPAKRQRRLAANARVEALAQGRAKVVDVAPLFTTANGAIDMSTPSGRLAYQDEHHLSEDGARRLRPLLGRVITEGLPAPR